MGLLDESFDLVKEHQSFNIPLGLDLLDVQDYTVSGHIVTMK